MGECPIPAPPGWRVFHGCLSGKGIEYDPPIPISACHMTQWLFVWAGLDQWVRPTYLPTDREHWVALRERRRAKLPSRPSTSA